MTAKLATKIKALLGQLVSVEYAKKCGWTAMYVSRRDLPDGYGRHQFFHIGIDPRDLGARPSLFGGIASPFNRRSRFSFTFRLPLPRVPWRPFASRPYLWAHRISHRFWIRFDHIIYPD